VTFCGWGVKVGMVRVWVAGKTVWFPCYTRAISKCVRLSRPLVGFWTHFKSPHFHSFIHSFISSERFRDERLRIKSYINSSVIILYVSTGSSRMTVRNNSLVFEHGNRQFWNIISFHCSQQRRQTFVITWLQTVRRTRKKFIK